MTRVLVPSVLALCLVGTWLAPMGFAAPAPTFSEVVVIEDDEADYGGGQAVGHLDLQYVYVTEKFLYDAERQEEKGSFLVFRIQTRNLGDMPCGGGAKYEIHFKLGGADKNDTAEVSRTAPGGNQGCAYSGGPGTNIVAGRDVFLIISEPALAIGPGTLLTDFWVQSFQVAGTTASPSQDVAPRPNNQAPADAPMGDLKQYTAMGVFPFITATQLTPLEQYSVGGQEVKYEFEFTTHPELGQDNVRVRFDYPQGWSISPSQGRTGADPEGQVTTIGGAPRAFSFTTSATGIVNEGDMAHIVMKVITDAGGYAEVMTMTTVSGPKVVDPNLLIDLVTKGPFTAGDETTIRFTASLLDGGVLESTVFSIDVLQGARRIGTVKAHDTGNGSYEARFVFPSEGAYTLDIYQSSLKPSPHQEFQVTAEGGGIVPGPGVALLLFGLLGAAWYRRRNR